MDFLHEQASVGFFLTSMSATIVNEESLATTDAKLPDWISGWGLDEFGVFVQFSLATGAKYWDFIDQRLRWIPAGTFKMGSPQTEAGRYQHEGPQHDVTLSRGYWIMDIPVTQRLWQHVMSDNPSRFRDDDRPVEQVDWNGAASFANACPN